MPSDPYRKPKDNTKKELKVIRYDREYAIQRQIEDSIYMARHPRWDRFGDIVIREYFNLHQSDLDNLTERDKEELFLEVMRCSK